MHTLYILFDHTCGLCTAAARWLREQPAYVRIITIPAMSERAARKFPELSLVPLVARHSVPGSPVPLHSMPGSSPPMPTIPPTTSTPDQVIVVTDTGLVYRGTSAWIMCLWALKKYRAWSVLMATPAWRPRVARIIDGLGRRRLVISRLLMLEAEADARAQSPADPHGPHDPHDPHGPDCPDGACHVSR